MKTAIASLNHETDDWEYISNFAKIFKDNNHVGGIGTAIGGRGNCDKLSSVTIGYATALLSQIALSAACDNQRKKQ